MLEELCRNAFYESCKATEEKTPLVTLRRAPLRQKSEFDGWFNQRSGYTNYHALPPLRKVTARYGSTLWRSWIYMNEHGEALCTAYIKLRFGGDMLQAMRSYSSFEELFDGFLQFFDEKRENFMAKTKNQIETQNKKMAPATRPQSHGGVANLLKVLTATMREQGSSIYTIAKVQYAVCVQAGIFIPEEFLTDVLVAHDLIEEAQE